MRTGVAFSMEERSSSPSIILTKKSTPTARTSGSANGSLISPRGSFVAIARPAAIIVAVAPTLDARSQLSSCVRGMAVLSEGGGDVAHLPQPGHRLIVRERESVALEELR